MNHLLVKYLILTKFFTALCLILHTKGPTHKKIAADCLEGIITEHFHLRHGEFNENRTMMFTVMVTNNMTSPSFEIQEDIIRRIHDIATWYQVEILSFGERIEFQSFEDCRRDDCQKRFIVDFKSDFYVIILDLKKNFDDMLQLLEDSQTFNPMALYLVYVEYEGSKYKETAKMILLKMWEKLLLRTAVLIPKTLQVFKLYKLDFATRGPYKCASNITLTEKDQCVKGEMLNIKQRYFKTVETTNYLNCSLNVISMPYEPFVINETHGLEIELLQNIGSIINVHFNITLSENITDDWGREDKPGNWSGKLKFVYHDYYLGVGNIQTGMSYAVDFTFSRFYYMESLVFVVPIARFVPKWRVLIAIFTFEMWAVCGGIIIFFAISFYVASKFVEEIYNFKNPGMCLDQSFQVFILHAVSKQPKSDFTRVFFVSLAVISIIMASAYTCSLVYYLKNPIREHQSSKNSDIIDQLGNYKYGIGGLLNYRELFAISDEEEGAGLYKMYQTAYGENDTMLYWIGKVAEDRDIWTVSSKFVVNYLLSEGSDITIAPDGKPKVYVFKKQLMSYSISIIMRKGHPILHNLNYAIQILKWGGHVNYIYNKYTRRSSEESKEDTPYKSLEIDNLQGAFALLVVGYLFGIVTLLLECLFKMYRDRKKKKVDAKRVKRKIRIGKHN